MYWFWEVGVVTRRRILGQITAAGLASMTLRAAARAEGADALAGKISFQGDPRYEAYRQAASWNARKPNRFPRAIVLAENEADVLAAVKLAKERDWRISARSGGHSWSASH